MPSRLVVGLYLASLALLPWSWFPPFPWLHAHAQWSDVVFAAAALAWAIERWQTRRWPRWQPWHLAILLYVGSAAGSLVFAAADKQAGALKLLGIAELGLLAVITADLAPRPGVWAAITRVMAVTTLAACAAAAAGLVLFYLDIPSRFVGAYGDLPRSPWYARVQAGTINPNMLASFAIAAAAVVARAGGAIPPWLRRATQAALALTVLLTMSRGIVGFALAAAIRRARTRGQRILAGASAVAAVALITSLTIWRLSFDPTQPTETRWDDGASINSRRVAFVTSWETLQSHPLWGIGVGTSPGLRRGYPFDAHFTPLSVAATMGLPALLAFVATLWLAWFKRERPTDVAVWSGLAGLALDGLAHDVEDFRHVWVLLGLAGVGAARARPRSSS